MNPCVAIYARVSSDQQAEAGTIASQLDALRKRAQDDGLKLSEDMVFADEGYSGANLARPSLERLRDAIAAGDLDRLYVQAPDRLARKYAYQVVLVEEFTRAGVELIFLSNQMGVSPEADLLLQVQGMIAEYERAKIMERSRRGKRHAASRGAVNVLSNAPYGYRYISKHDNEGEATFQIILEEAKIVREIFSWVGLQRASLGEVCRRLTEQGCPTRTGKSYWDRSVVWGILKNPAYIGRAAFGKTKSGPKRPQLRPQRGCPAQPRRAYSTYAVPEEDWISIPVPPLVDEHLFQAVALQLEENRKRNRQRKRGASYLLQGLITCKQCGYAFYGKPVSRKAAHGKSKRYTYYRCIGTDAYRFGGERQCSNKQVRTDLLEEAVWNKVLELLANPQRMEDEYRRRLDGLKKKGGEPSLGKLNTQERKLQRGISRLIDGYADGLIDKKEFEPRIRRLKKRLADLQTQLRDLADDAKMEGELRLIVGRLEGFGSQVQDGLEKADWSTRRELLRTLIKQVVVDHESINVIFRIEMTPPLGGSGKPSPGGPPSSGSKGSPPERPEKGMQESLRRDFPVTG